MCIVKVINRAARVTGWQKSFRKCLRFRENPERSRRTAAHAASGCDSRMLLLQDRTKRRKNHINMTKYREIKK